MRIHASSIIIFFLLSGPRVIRGGGGGALERHPLSNCTFKQQNAGERVRGAKRKETLIAVARLGVYIMHKFISDND